VVMAELKRAASLMTNEDAPPAGKPTLVAFTIQPNKLVLLLDGIDFKAASHWIWAWLKASGVLLNSHLDRQGLFWERPNMRWVFTPREAALSEAREMLRELKEVDSQSDFWFAQFAKPPHGPSLDDLPIVAAPKPRLKAADPRRVTAPVARDTAANSKQTPVAKPLGLRSARGKAG
jgi:hypothetical protein